MQVNSARLVDANVGRRARIQANGACQRKMPMVGRGRQWSRSIEEIEVEVMAVVINRV